MATRGRKPNPTHLKVVAGNPGKRALNKNEPKPRGDLLAAPEWLSESQRAGWAYAIANSPGGLLKLLDRSVLVTWVVAEDLHRQATEAVNAEGLTAVTKDGFVIQNPHLAIINRQSQVMHKAAAEMGFTPSSRSRISVSVDDDEKGGEFAEFAAG